MTALAEGCWLHAKVLLQFLIILSKQHLLYLISPQQVDVLRRKE